MDHSGRTESTPSKEEAATPNIHRSSSTGQGVDPGPALGPAHRQWRREDRVLAGAGRKASLYHEVAPCPYPHLEPADLTTDAVFGHLRLAGLNPVLVQTVRHRERVAECAALGDIVGEFERAEHGSFDAAVQEGRVTVVAPEAFALIEHLRATDKPEHPYEPRFFCRPTAVFVRRPHESHLRPVAIRCHPTFATITPAHGQIWERAKLHFQVADSLYHTFVSHLPQTHFLIEPVVLATRNALGHDHVGADHPVRRLLDPHFEGTSAVNRVARGTLLDGSSSFRQFVAADAASTTAMMSAAFAERALRFTTSFDAHRVESVDRALVYPFRDDFERVRAPVVEWVEDFVRLSYETDEDVRQDVRLQAWGSHLRDPSRGRLTGLPPLSDIPTLQRVLSTIVQIAALQRASFHFPQTDLGRLAYAIPFYAADVPPGQCMAQEASLRWLDQPPRSPRRGVAVLCPWSTRSSMGDAAGPPESARGPRARVGPTDVRPPPRGGASDHRP